MPPKRPIRSGMRVVYRKVEDPDLGKPKPKGFEPLRHGDIEKADENRLVVILSKAIADRPLFHEK